MVKKAVHADFIAEDKAEAQKEFYRSRFSFINKHNGIRPKCLHGLIGPMGVGKSTALKAIVEDSAEFAPVLVWLSEEKTQQWQAKITRHLKNIYFEEENELDPVHLRNIESFFDCFEGKIIESKAKIVFIDNVTTSYIYSDTIGIKGQDYAARRLSRLPSKLGVSVFYLAHTKKEITTNHIRMITPEDIRGSGQLPIRTEYLYLFHKFTINQKPCSIIKTDKHRHHDDGASISLLVWKDGVYVGDELLSFDTLKKIFKNKDNLGGK